MILHFIAQAAAAAIVLAACVVIYATPWRNGRWISTLGWMATALAALMVMVSPPATGVEPLVLTLLMLTLAIVCWQHMPHLLERAARPAQVRVPAALMAAGLLAGCLVAVPVVAMDLALELPPEVAEKCDAEGGCTLITRQRADRLMKEAYEAGKKTCRNSL